MAEFQQRKRAAAVNKQRGVAQWMGAGYSPRPLPQDPTPAGTYVGQDRIGLHTIHTQPLTTSVAGQIPPKQNIHKNRAEEV